LCDFILIEKSIISEFLAGSEIEKNETKIKKKSTKHGWCARDYMKNILRSSIFKNNVMYTI
jgi:hypothetical protein